MAKDGKRITFAYLRERAGLTQREISIAMDVTVTTVSQWETGARRPRLFPEQIQKLLQVLDCTLEEFVEAFSQNEQ
ncbi:MAG: helix-turn-helix transcriptional regulator [Coleofasciculus chthonoplastes F3-SA18-01]|jgi:transcriptional regulator with XRE-family HTH domain|uniref:helix-turn-helix domain-containing protein n=1 Tax=Coleofasciculus chthonoplastes TaxID=64178 RepID=UPI0032FB1F35